jgi:hypothetical protein
MSIVTVAFVRGLKVVLVPAFALAVAGSLIGCGGGASPDPSGTSQEGTTENPPGDPAPEADGGADAQPMPEDNLGRNEGSAGAGSWAPAPAGTGAQTPKKQ